MRRAGIAVAPMMGLASLLQACAGEPPRAQTAQTVDVAKVDAGPAAPPPPEDPAAAREELARLIDAAIVIVEDYFTRCTARERGGSTSGSLQQLRAGLYADRDEITLRNQGGNWEGRDVSAWLKQRRAQMTEAKRALADCTR